LRLCTAMKFFDVLFALFFGVCRWNAVPTGLPFRVQVRGNPRYGGVLSVPPRLEVEKSLFR